MTCKSVRGWSPSPGRLTCESVGDWPRRRGTYHPGWCRTSSVTREWSALRLTCQWIVTFHAPEAGSAPWARTTQARLGRPRAPRLAPAGPAGAMTAVSPGGPGRWPGRPGDGLPGGPGATHPSHGEAVLTKLRRRSRATTQLWSGYSRRSALRRHRIHIEQY